MKGIWEFFVLFWQLFVKSDFRQKKKKVKKKEENSQNWKGYTSFIEELSSWLTLNLFKPTHRIVPGDFNIHTGDPPFNTLVFHFLDLLSSNESVLQLTSTTHPLNLLLPITPTLIISLKNRIPVPKQHLHLLFQLHWLTLPRQSIYSTTFFLPLNLMSLLLSLPSSGSIVFEDNHSPISQFSWPLLLPCTC